MLNPLFFDRLIIVLFACACVRHAFDGNAPKAMYWLSAAVLNVSILSMGK